MADYVSCPVTITSPHPDYGLPANLRCGDRCPVVDEAEAMHFRCSFGHHFYAGPTQIVRDPAPRDAQSPLDKP